MPFTTYTTRCAKCRDPLGQYLQFWPGLGAICGNCRSALEIGSIRLRVPVDPLDGPASPTRAYFDRHYFTVRSFKWGPDMPYEYWAQCPDCYQVRPPYMGNQAWVEPGRCPAAKSYEGQ